MEASIQQQKYTNSNGKLKDCNNGQEALNSLIRSSILINYIHEAIKNIDPLYFYTAIKALHDKYSRLIKTIQ